MTLHILLERQSNGHVLAQVSSLPGCTLERATREEAIEAIQKLLSEKLATVKLLPVHVLSQPSSSTQSWKPFLGMFKDDPYFAEISEELWAKRQSDDDEEIPIDWIAHGHTVGCQAASAQFCNLRAGTCEKSL
jgi:predicted RNase H-like HicB family nuclease